MKRVRSKTALLIAGGCLIAALIATSSAHSAQATVTSSHITTPKDLSYFVYNKNKPNIFHIAGTSNGTTGDHVDVDCYAGDKTQSVATNVAVNANGSFSVPSADLSQANIYRVCQLKAVPAGTTPNPLTPYRGPRLLVGLSGTSTISGGPNNGKPYDFDTEAQQLDGSFDYDSIAGCGIDDGYMLDSTDSLSTVTFYCNDWLTEGGDISPNRSQLQIDGMNAYTAETAKEINSNAAGFKAMAYSYSLDPKTGNFVIHDTEALVKCPEQTWPPTDVTCANFVSAGVTDHRTMAQDHKGRVVWVTDVFTSTDGKAHKLDLQWQNDQHFYGQGGNSANIAYKFPGQSSYSTHLLNDAVSLPAKPGTIFIRVNGAADGDTNAGQGAIVYNRPAIKATFDKTETSQNDFNLEQKATVPAKGSVTFRTAYIQEFYAAQVASLAAMATTMFKGCTVPNVVGKSLSSAKKAIKKAHCAVGKITHAQSMTIPAGRVVFEQPKAKTHVDYGKKVSLVVSTG